MAPSLIEIYSYSYLRFYFTSSSQLTHFLTTINFTIMLPVCVTICHCGVTDVPIDQRRLSWFSIAINESIYFAIYKLSTRRTCSHVLYCNLTTAPTRSHVGR